MFYCCNATVIIVNKDLHYICMHSCKKKLPIVLSDNYTQGKGVKVGFHYPSSRAEFTGRVDGPRTRVHFLTPVNSGRELG